MMYRAIVFVFLCCFSVIACNTTSEPTEQALSTETGAGYLHKWNDTMTMAMVEDIVSPPVASRMYVYPNLAAYEVLAHLDPDFNSLAGQIAGLDTTPVPTGIVDPMLASSVAFASVSQRLIFNPTPLHEYEAELVEKMEETLSASVLEASIAYGEEVADAIMAYSATDNYAQTRTMPRYRVTTEDVGRWQPTPPDYVDGLEPNWNQVRPFVLASADQFTPVRPTPFDSSRTSLFWEEMIEVYDAVAQADDEVVEIAQFWDCNPFASTHDGHTVTFAKKITPGGHWIGIAGLAARKAEANAMKTAEAYTLSALAIFDAFISCWDEKYRSNLTRPETVINRYYDPDWRPILQTPPFPEYTSGHSVASGSASVVLTHLFGESFSFNDSTEVAFGLPVRSFESFRQAADEAAISRLYGGIHYRPAVEHGVSQGRQVGETIINNIYTRSDQVTQNTGQ